MSSVEITETTRKFSLKRNEQEIELELEDGSIGLYVLREMTGAQRDVYLKAAMSKAKFNPDGSVASVIDPTGLQPTLISLCMFEKGKPNSVDAKFVNNIRTTVQNEIFELCSKLNGLDKDAEESSKNV